MAVAASEGGEACGRERRAGWLLGLRELVGWPAAARWRGWPVAVRWQAEQAEPTMGLLSFFIFFSFIFISFV